MRIDHRMFCREADTVSLSYTTCYAGLARYCYESSYVVADTFTNALVFFYSRFLGSNEPISRMHAKRTT